MVRRARRRHRIAQPVTVILGARVAHVDFCSLRLTPCGAIISRTRARRNRAVETPTRLAALLFVAPRSYCSPRHARRSAQPRPAAHPPIPVHGLRRGNTPHPPRRVGTRGGAVNPHGSQPHGHPPGRNARMPNYTGSTAAAESSSATRRRRRATIDHPTNLLVAKQGLTTPESGHACFAIPGIPDLREQTREIQRFAFVAVLDLSSAAPRLPHISEAFRGVVSGLRRGSRCSQAQRRLFGVVLVVRALLTVPIPSSYGPLATATNRKRLP